MPPSGTAVMRKGFADSDRLAAGFGMAGRILHCGFDQHAGGALVQGRPAKYSGNWRSK